MEAFPWGKITLPEVGTLRKLIGEKKIFETGGVCMRSGVVLMGCACEGLGDKIKIIL